jgi:hypothetical protein
MRLSVIVALLTAYLYAQPSSNIHIQAQLNSSLKLKKARVGDKLKAETVSQVTLANGTTIPTGSAILGEIKSVDAGFVTVAFNAVSMDGKRMPLDITLVAAALIGGKEDKPGNAKMDSPSPDNHPLNGVPRSVAETGADTLKGVSHGTLSEVNADGSDKANTHATAVAAHPGSVIGLPGVTLAIDEAAPFASKFTIANKDMQLPQGVQLMFTVR